MRHIHSYCPFAYAPLPIVAVKDNQVSVSSYNPTLAKYAYIFYKCLKIISGKFIV